MRNEDHRLGSASSPERWRRIVLALLVGSVAVALVVTGLALQSGSAPTGSTPQPTSSSTAATTTTTIAEEDQVVARLREILRVRDRAYRERNPDLLQEVYTPDCPCLRGDGDAIRQLIADDAVWVGASTSAKIRKLDKENDRLWIVIADLIGSSFRIETEAGDLIRAVEGRRELFRFALARETPENSLLLGLAAPVDAGYG